mgnify:CR=1 FL=1
MKKFILFFILLLFISACTNQNKNDYKIIDVHEHLQDEKNAYKLLYGMEKNSIDKTVLLGTSDETFYLDGRDFVGYDKNNEEIIKIQEKYPDKLIAFCTLNPDDPEKLEKLKKCHKNGAKGLKLYSGHSHFYTIPLNDSSMYPVYQYLQDNNIPIVWHVNLFTYYYEFEQVLNNFPNLIVDCPHFCLSLYNLYILGDFFDRYPNLYIDISLGGNEDNPYATQGWEIVDERLDTTKEFFIKYQDRILYGFDDVVTSHPTKTKERVAEIGRCYRDFLEKDKFECKRFKSKTKGLNLSPEILKKIYEDNPKRFLGRK